MECGNARVRMFELDKVLGSHFGGFHSVQQRCDSNKISYVSFVPLNLQAGR